MESSASTPQSPRFASWRNGPSLDSLQGSAPRRTILLIAAGVFLLALIPRLWNVAYRLPEPDELHWIERSYKVVERLRAHQYSGSTTHLGHPGLPPALVMAAGEVFSERWNDAIHADRCDWRFVDRLTAARSANAIISSLLPAATVLCLSSFLGLGTSVLIGLVIALDPRFIGLGRIAHIDGALALFSFLSAVTFFAAEERRSVRLKLAAGLWWGLAFMTKPTAVALIPAFILYKLIVSRDDRTRNPVDWSDLGAVLIAHVLFGAVYTRLWPHESDYLIRLRIHSRLADAVYAAGMAVRETPIMHYALCAVLAALMGLAIRLVLRPRVASQTGAISGAAPNATERATPPLPMIVLLGSSLLLTVLLFPAICENIIRFWSWVLGLSSVAHTAYGRTLPAPPGGYPFLFLTRVPSLMVLAFIAGTLGLFATRGRALRSVPESVSKLLLLSVIVVFIWTGLLSTSSKQTFRYILPTIPFLYLIGLVLLRGALANVDRRLIAAASIVLVAGQAVASMKIAPYYEFFFNDLSGGLAGATARGHMLPLGGAESLTDALYDRAKKEGRRFGLGVVGDYEAMVLGYRHRYQDLKGDTISVIPDHDATNADYVIALGWRREQALARGEIRTGSLRSDQVFKIENVVVSELFEYEVPGYEVPEYFPVSQFHRMTGTVVGTPDELVAELGPDIVELVAKKHPKGYAMTGVSLRFKRGSYRITATARFLEKPEHFISEPGAEVHNPAVLRLNLGKDCEKLFRIADFSPDGVSKLELVCSFDAVKRPQLSAYWFGRQSIALGQIAIIADRSEEREGPAGAAR